MIIYTHVSIPNTLVFSSQYITSKSSNLSQSQKYISVWNRNGEQKKLIFSDSKKWGSSGELGFRVGFSASDGLSSDSSDNSNFLKKIKVVDHITLLKAKEGLSDEDEKDMLDHLYTFQYQMGGIIAISLGRAVYMRFQGKEDLVKFYENTFYLGVLKDHVMPYSHELRYVDYEVEVEDDILPIFRKGQEFNYGLEFMLLISVAESERGDPIEDALLAHANLAREFPSLIVQCTQGSNFNLSSKEYSHAVVIRFRSSETFEMFVGNSEYREMWTSKFAPIVQKTLDQHYYI
ncbi:hypothetical protein MKX01_035443 [Papaver californicum]|nr:hypothetical protein MKX01_035443 [Papaver californicum]